MPRWRIICPLGYDGRVACDIPCCPSSATPSVATIASSWRPAVPVFVGLSSAVVQSVFLPLRATSLRCIPIHGLKVLATPSRTSAANSGLNGVTTPFAPARLDRADRTHAALRQTMTSEDSKERLHISRALWARLIGIAVVGSISRHRTRRTSRLPIELVDQSVQAVRHGYCRTLMTPRPAISCRSPLSWTRLDNVPDGMQEIATKVASLPGG